jgi:hypothetical protein
MELYILHFSSVNSQYPVVDYLVCRLSLHLCVCTLFVVNHMDMCELYLHPTLILNSVWRWGAGSNSDNGISGSGCHTYFPNVFPMLCIKRQSDSQV